MIHLIIHKSEWLTTSQQERTIKTSFNQGKLVTHVKDLLKTKKKFDCL